MISDVIRINNKGDGFKEALDQTEAVAAYRSLGRKEAIQMRLLAEEMTGMLLTLTGEIEADYTIESNGKSFKLELVTRTLMTGDKRRKLLAVSTTGENAAAKGFMGKLGDIFARALEPVGDTPDGYFSSGWFTPVLGSSEFPNMSALEADTWSLTQYKDSLGDKKEKPEWDELEKSIVASLADNVEISIKSDCVRLIIYKTFA